MCRGASPAPRPCLLLKTTLPFVAPLLVVCCSFPWNVVLSLYQLTAFGLAQGGQERLSVFTPSVLIVCVSVIILLFSFPSFTTFM